MNICLFKQGEVGHPLQEVDVAHILQDFPHPESRHPYSRRTQQEWFPRYATTIGWRQRYTTPLPRIQTPVVPRYPTPRYATTTVPRYPTPRYATTTVPEAEVHSSNTNNSKYGALFRHKRTNTVYNVTDDCAKKIKTRDSFCK